MAVDQDFFSVETPNAAAFSAAPQVNMPFMALELEFHLRTGAAGTVDFSFDGTNIHGTLDLSERATIARPRTCGRNVVWLKSAAGSESVEVHAWTK